MMIANSRDHEWTAEDIEAAKIRFAQMDDSALKRTLDAAESLTRPESTWSGTPRRCFVIQLAIAEQEWERRAIIDDSWFGIVQFSREILMTMARAAVLLAH